MNTGAMVEANHKPEPVFQTGLLPPVAIEIVRSILMVLFRVLTRLEVRGLENLPPNGGFILAINHLSWLDAPLTYALVRNRKLTAFAADTYRSRPFFRAFVRCIDVVWVHRGAITPSTLKHAIRALQKGVMCVSPEGTRSKTHSLLRGQPGAAFLAVAAGVPVVPLTLDHSHLVLPSLLRIKRQPLTVNIGKPLRFPPSAQRRPDIHTLETYTEEIMCHIAALLPPERRGVYADHARVTELLPVSGAEPAAAPAGS